MSSEKHGQLPLTTVTIAEFIASGTPISVQGSSASKLRWKARVSAAASLTLPAGFVPVADPVRVTIVYFYVTTDVDLDNILKPIVDALNQVVYVDDSQVANIMAAKRDQSSTFILEGASPVIIEQLTAAAIEPRDFIYVAVELVNLAAIL